MLNECSILTSNIVSVSGVDLLDAAISKRQFAHPVDATTHSGRQTQTSVCRRRMKTIRHEVVTTETINSYFVPAFTQRSALDLNPEPMPV